MQNKLTAAQLGRRLGRGLKIQHSIDNYIFSLDVSSVSIAIAHCSQGLSKPILFPLSFLTKEITIKGYNDDKPFVPLHKIYDRNIGFVKCFEDRKEYVLVEGSEEKPVVTYYSKDITTWEYWKIELLIFFHFAIDEPEGSYIEVTDEFQPYAP